MTSELRPAVEVVVDVLNAAERAQFTQQTKLQNAVGYVEADREAVRAEQAVELAKFKALAETLARALARCGRIVERHNWRQSEKVDDVKRIVAETLRQYKETTQ